AGDVCHGRPGRVQRPRPFCVGSAGVTIRSRPGRPWHTDRRGRPRSCLKTPPPAPPRSGVGENRLFSPLPASGRGRGRGCRGAHNGGAHDPRKSKQSFTIRPPTREDRPPGPNPELSPEVATVSWDETPASARAERKNVTGAENAAL